MDVDKCIRKLIELNKMELIEYLIKKGGVNLRARNDEGMTCLHLAVKKSCWEIVELLLKADRSLINEVVDFSEGEENANVGYTALHFSAERKNIKIAELLLSFGAKVDVVDRNMRTPLHVSALYGNRKFLKLILNNGAPIDALDSDGKTALMYVLDKNHVEQIRIFAESVYKECMIDLLELAVINLNVPIVRYLLDSFTIDVTQPLKYGRTLIHVCLLSKDLVAKSEVADFQTKYNSNPNEEEKFEIFKLLLQRNVDINTVCNEGLSALHIAAALGYTKIVKFILDYYIFHFSVGRLNSGIDIKSKNGKTPLMYAVEHGHVNIVKLLLWAKGKIDHRITDIKSIIKIESESTCEDIALLLLENLKNTELYDLLLTEALKYGFEKKFVNLIDVLICVNISLSREETLKESKWTALVGRVDKNSMDIVQFLMKHNFIIKFVDTEIALHFAVINNYDDILDCCLQEGVNVDYKNVEGNSLLYVICLKNNLHAAMKCIVLGGDVNIKNSSGETALHAAVRTINPELVRLLLDSGCDLNANNNNWETPFIVFLRNLCTEFYSSLWKKSNVRTVMRVAEMLVTSGTDLTCCEDNINLCVLHLSMQTEIVELLRMVVQHHPSLDCLEKDTGKTCLHVAAERNNFEVMKALLELGGNLNVRDKSNDIPLTIAIKKQHFKIVELLVNYSNMNAFSGKEALINLAVTHGNGSKAYENTVNALICAGADLHQDVNGLLPFCCEGTAKNTQKNYPHLMKVGFDINHLPRHPECVFCERIVVQYGVPTHALKLRLIGQHLNENILLLQEYLVSRREDVYQDICEEAGRLMSCNIKGTNIPFVNIIRSDVKILAKYAINKCVVKVFKDIDTLKQEWPHYWQLLTTSMSKGWCRRRLLDKCHEIFKSDVLGVLAKMPHVCVSLILDNLENSQLQTLIASYYHSVDTSEFDDVWWFYSNADT